MREFIELRKASTGHNPITFKKKTILIGIDLQFLIMLSFNYLVSKKNST